MRTSKKWLDAQSEHKTTLRALPSCLTLCDLKHDGYHQLVAAEFPMEIQGKSKLKAYKGTTLISEQSLPGIPTAVESFYVDEHFPKIPVIAVAIGSSVLFYRNMKPYYKYTLPSLPINPIENDVWQKLPNEKPENYELHINQLRRLNIGELSEASQKLVFAPPDDIQQFVKDIESKDLKRFTNITATATIRKSSTDTNGVSYLILATESGDVIFLDCQAFTVTHEARVCAFKTTPSLISVSGHFDVDYRIVIGTREGSICILRKSWLEGRQIIKLDNPTIGLSILPIEQTIIVVCMNKTLDCFSKKGKQLWSVGLNEPATCMVHIILTHISMTLICVAMRGGLVQLYLQKHLVDQFTVADTVSAMAFGKLGQEDHVLILVTNDGSFIVKILKRTAEFKVDSNYNHLNDGTGNSSSKLQIPKKSKVFLEQTIRECDNASAIYHNFQTELWRLRLTAARTTIDTINSAESTISGDVGSAPIKLAAEVLGLGPVFRIVLTLENMAARRDAPHINVLLHADDQHYCLEKPYASLPTLVPGSPIKIDFKITTLLDPNDGLPPSDLTPENAIVRVMLLKSGHAKPLIAATIAMPMTEPLENDIY
ncbi:Bardet-Biedl syndrome 1 protein like [Pseudolycoriella hygida]|uniref:Bardet-Biedl syndrome 1 protein like n=1 Tax=Pseudolycoriella hygida TaxID=35572 RepID=A0A9Q0MZ79_9DIPT|nr:Bardet-Biedl syndrome 1 protein like [Pseudolycoriella hygida]